MNRFSRSLVLAAVTAAAGLASLPARADFYTLEGRFQCLDKADEICGSATPEPRRTQKPSPKQAQAQTLQLRPRAPAASSDLEKLLASTGVDIERLLDKLEATPTAQGGPFIALGDARLAEFGKQRLEDLKKLAKMLPLAPPLASYQIESGFGPRVDPINHRPSFHPGIDLSAPYRSAVYSTAPGTVIFTGTEEGYGRTVDIDHGHGIVTRYAHLHRILVARGQKVGVHVEIGELGSTGRATGPHVHYEVQVDGTPVDPAKFMEAGRNVVEISASATSAVPSVADRPADPAVTRQIFYRLLQVEDHVRSGHPSTADIDTLKMTARAGDPHATELLAWCKFKGLGTNRDPVAAYLLYGIAAVARLPHAGENQAAIYETVLTPEQRQHVLDAANANIPAVQIIAGN